MVRALILLMLIRIEEGRKLTSGHLCRLRFVESVRIAVAVGHGVVQGRERWKTGVGGLPRVRLIRIGATICSRMVSAISRRAVLSVDAHGAGAGRIRRLAR